MDSCNFKWIIIGFCLLIAVIGLYLAFIREKTNIARGNSDTQSLSVDTKTGAGSANFAIGLVLIVIGLGGAIYCTIKLPDCGKQTDPPPVDSSKLKHADTSHVVKPAKRHDKPAAPTAYLISPYITPNANKDYPLSGLVKGQNTLNLKGYYRYHAQGAYKVTINLNIYWNGSKINAISIDADPDKDVLFDQTIFIDNTGSDDKNLSFSIDATGWTLSKDAYIDFKKGLNITLVK